MEEMKLEGIEEMKYLHGNSVSELRTRFLLTDKTIISCYKIHWDNSIAFKKEIFQLRNSNILRDYLNGVKKKELMKKYLISKSRIEAIIKGQKDLVKPKNKMLKENNVENDYTSKDVLWGGYGKKIEERYFDGKESFLYKRIDQETPPSKVVKDVDFKLCF